MPVCPRSPWVLVCEEEPTMRIPRPCGSYRCSVCCKPKIGERVRVMTWAAGRCSDLRLVTLTRLPEQWQRARWQVRDLVRRLRKHYRVEWAWAIEANPKSTGYHAHAIQHGDFIPQRHLTELWGGRITDIRRVSKAANGYVTKCAGVAGYLTKGAEQHLAINGGRPIHMTRGYLHGLTSREVLKEMSTGKHWHVEPATREEMNVEEIAESYQQWVNRLTDQ